MADIYNFTYSFVSQPAVTKEDKIVEENLFQSWWETAFNFIKLTLSSNLGSEKITLFYAKVIFNKISFL